MQPGAYEPVDLEPAQLVHAIGGALCEGLVDGLVGGAAVGVRHLDRDGPIGGAADGVRCPEDQRPLRKIKGPSVLVVVLVVAGVSVAVMHIVDVVAVYHGLVPAVRPMRVVVHLGLDMGL